MKNICYYIIALSIYTFCMPASFAQQLISPLDKEALALGGKCSNWSRYALSQDRKETRKVCEDLQKDGFYNAAAIYLSGTCYICDKQDWTALKPDPFVAKGWVSLGRLDRFCKKELLCGGAIPVCGSGNRGKVIQDRIAHNNCVAEECSGGSQLTNNTYVCK